MRDSGPRRGHWVCKRWGCNTGIAAALAQARLGACNEVRIDTVVMRGDAGRAIYGRSQRGEASGRALQSKLLKYLAAVGALVAQDAPDLGAPFRLPRGNASNQAFLTAARGLS